jgi:glycosyltransferase involved in cell wall biosynthesis
MAICRYPHYQAALGSVPAAAPSIYLPPAVLLTQIALALREEGWKERAFFRLWEKQIRAVERRAIEGARRIVVFSRVMRDQLESAYGVSPARVEINPPGVDTGKFSPGEKNPDLARRWGLDLRVPVVLCVIRLSAEKNLSFLVESTAPLLKSDRCRLLLVGEGPSRARLEAKTREMGLEGKVVFTGRADFPERYYRLADVFVSPSRYEPFGQVLIEAMASGIPVIALKSDPPRISTAAEEIIEDGGSGFVVPEEPVVLRQKLELLLGNKELRLKMGEKGREICLKKFTWEKHLSGLLAPR